MIGIQQVTWHSPYGEQINLFSKEKSGLRYKALLGTSGEFSPSLLFNSIKIPNQAGEYLNFNQIGTRTLIIPLHISADNQTSLHEGIQTLVQSFRPKTDMFGKPITGKLHYQIADTIRFLNCSYQNGLEKPIQQGDRFATFQLKFSAYDPFWYQDALTEHQFSLGDSLTSWFPWQFPWKTSNASIFTELNIHLEKSWHVAPLFVITGPTNQIILENTTSNHSLTIDHELSQEETIIVDMQNKTISINQNPDSNLWSSTTGEMWNFVPGDNHLNLKLSDATQDTQVTLTYRERFFSL